MKEQEHAETCISKDYDKQTKKYQLTQKIKDKALELGYAACGVTSAQHFEGYREEMLDRGNYEFIVNRPKGSFVGAHPEKLTPNAKSIIVTISDFSKIRYPEELTQHIGRAYLGREYLAQEKSTQGAKRKLFIDFLSELGIETYQDNPLCLPDRPAAARAGVITFGKNNFAYAKGCGSFNIINTFLVDCELEYDKPTVERPCPENCTACIDACPTGALYAPGKLDPSKCMLFAQIVPAAISLEMRENLGQHIHGCDLCQEVCPRNKKVLENAPLTNPFIQRLAEEFSLEKVLLMDDKYYDHFVKPVMYNYIQERWMFQRNAAIALGNSGDVSQLPALYAAREKCADQAQEYIEWAIAKLETPEPVEA